MKSRLFLLVLILTFITTLNDAYAYIRPGAGNDLIQIIISAFASIGVFFKNIINKIKSFFTGKK